MSPQAATVTNTTPTTSTTDPHLVALLSYLLGRDTTEEFAETMIGNATRGARELLSSLPLLTTFDMMADRPGVDEIVVRGVRQWLYRDDSSVPEDILRRQQQAFEAAVAADDDTLLNEFTTSGLMLGAVLMYELLLRGGAR